MAKLKISPVVIEGNPYSGEFNLDINGKGTVGIYDDAETNSSITFFGEKLKGGSGDFSEFIVSGTIDKIVYRNQEDLVTATITGDFNAKQLGKAFAADGLVGLANSILKGNDTVTGSDIGDYLAGYRGDDKINGGGGVDNLFGGAGDDILNGGKGSDYFHFEGDKTGNDVIKDFHVQGDDVDYFSFEDTSVVSAKSANKGHDTLLTLTDGSTILLDGVTRNEYEAYADSMWQS